MRHGIRGFEQQLRGCTPEYATGQHIPRQSFNHIVERDRQDARLAIK